MLQHHVIIYKFVTDVIIKFYFILILNNKLIFNVNFFHYFFNQSKIIKTNFIIVINYIEFIYLYILY